MTKKRSKPPKGYVYVESEWLDRTFVQGPRLCLCTSQDLFNSVTKLIGWEHAGRYLEEGMEARVRIWTNDKGFRYAVVCIDREKARDLKRPGIEVACLLTHEAVHVFQDQCDYIGEQFPSKEFQAYAIQNITQSLLEEYAKQYAQAYPDD